MGTKVSIEEVVTIEPNVTNALQAIQADAAVQKALSDIKKDDNWALQEMITITEIPAPPFKEDERGAFLLKRFQELGLQDVKKDDEGNIIAKRQGVDPKGPVFVVSAHIDTVFPEGTDVTVKEVDGVYHAPGMGDNVRGVVSMLAILKVMNQNQIQTVGDILFVGTVGEEGRGDLRGSKALFKNNSNIAGFISLDNGQMNGLISRSTGSHRYEVTFTGPGGHSFLSFGKVPSATHAMGRAIAKIADMQVPTNPITTFTVGTARGGESINAIAYEATMGLDLRSNDNDALLAIEAEAIRLINQAVEEENQRWDTEEKITVELKLVGNRPAGTMDDNSTIVQAGVASLQAVGIEGIELKASSTDSNVPMSLGIPSLTLGKGGVGGEIHTTDEWYKHENGWLGAQNGLLLTLLLTGLANVTEPLLATR